MEAGNVYLIPWFPNQEDSTRGTARWIMVIEDLADIVTCVPITKSLHQTINYKKYIIVNKSSPEGIAMNLEFDSLFMLDRILDLKKSIHQPFRLKGKCPDELLQKIMGMLDF